MNAYNMHSSDVVLVEAAVGFAELLSPSSCGSEKENNFQYRDDYVHDRVFFHHIIQTRYL